uniref:SFRICE_018113 n=1 Tax=Spodoptera frugiperda TaxID=7108 RepID=A0A2H1W9G8_SPOFR
MRQYIALWVAAVVLFYVENGQAQILTYDVRLNNLLRMQQGIGWPLHLNLAEGHDALLRLSKRLENQQNCEITTPSGLTFNIHNPPNNRYSAWSDGCGVRVHNVSPSDTGRWRMTATGGNHSITGWSEVHVAEKVTGYTEDTITLKDGSTNTLVELTSLNSSYCFVTQPFSESSLVPGQCEVTLDRTSRAVQGRWSVVLGIPGRVTELHVDRSVAVEGERLDVGFVRDSNNHIHLYCNILYTEKNITFCRFQKTTETSGLNIMDGLSDGRYSYYGDGFFKKHCGLTIESATSADYGTWRCTIGVQERVGTVIYQRTPMQALITVSEQEAPKIRRELTRDSSESDEEMRTVFVEENTSLTLTCRADASLQYCWFQHPNGSQYTPVERQVQGEQAFWYTGENLQSGDCGITFAHVSEIDSGIWTCHMGYKYQLGVEVTQDMEVRVTGSLAANKQEVQTEIGGATTLYCHTSNGPRPLDYCRFLSPKFIGMNLDSSVTAENAILNRYYFTPGRLLSHGDCSLTIDPVTADDLGHWFCAGLLHDQVVESKDTIHVYQERHRMPALQASLIGTSVGIVFLGLVFVGVLWYKKGWRLPWPTSLKRFSTRTETESMNINRVPGTVNIERRSSNSTTSSNEFA